MQHGGRDALREARQERRGDRRRGAVQRSLCRSRQQLHARARHSVARPRNPLQPGNALETLGSESAKQDEQHDVRNRAKDSVAT